MWCVALSVWVSAASARPLGTWARAAELAAPGLPARVPAGLRAEAEWLVALEGAQAGEPVPMARWLQAHPEPSPLADAGWEWVLVAIRDRAFDRDVDPGAVLDEVWAVAPFAPTVHEARLGLLRVLDAFSQPEPAFEARVAAAMAESRAEVLPAFALRLLAPGPWSPPLDAARVRWVAAQLGQDGRWWDAPHGLEATALAWEVRRTLPAADPTGEDWPPAVPTPPAGRTAPGPGSQHRSPPWRPPVPGLAPWLDAPDPDAAAAWNAGRYREARRAAERWSRTRPDAPQNWVWWVRAWSRPGTERGAAALRALVAAPDDPSYRWAAAHALIEHLAASVEAPASIPAPVRAELAALRAVLPGDPPPVESLVAGPPAPLPVLPDRGATERVCCATGHPAPVVVAVAGGRDTPEIVPFVPRVTQDPCGDLGPWLQDVRPGLAACVGAGPGGDGSWVVTRDGATGPDDEVSRCLAALAAAGPPVGFTVVVRDLRRSGRTGGG